MTDSIKVTVANSCGGRVVITAAAALLIGFAIGFALGEARLRPIRDAANEASRLRARNAQLEDCVRSQVRRIGDLEVALKRANTATLERQK